MILSALGVRQKESNADAIRQLGQHEVISDATTEKLAKAAGFRNVLAHNMAR